jgi:hypothetical protein
MSKKAAKMELVKVAASQIQSGNIYRTDNLARMDESIDALQTVLDNLVRNVDVDNIKCDTLADVYKLSIAVTGLTRARTEHEKLKMEVSGLVNEAADKLRAEIRDLMDSEPELAFKLRDIIAKAQQNLAKAE